MTEAIRGGKDGANLSSRPRKPYLLVTQRNATPLGFVVSGSTSQLFLTAKEAGKTQGEREGGEEKKSRERAK